MVGKGVQGCPGGGVGGTAQGCPGGGADQKRSV